jgi:hypothetical protein
MKPLDFSIQVPSIAMYTCPKCSQPVKPTEVTCPHCWTQLKAFGHQGIDLHHVKPGQDSLCTTCTYHADNSCNYPKRPLAKECTLYQDMQIRNPSARRVSPVPASHPSKTPAPSIADWLRQHQGLSLIIGLLVLCILVAIVRR